MAIVNETCVSFCNQPKAHFGLPLDNRGKCHVDENRIQCLSKYCSMYPLYPSIFDRLWAIARHWSEITTFFYPSLHLTPPLGCSHWNSGKMFGSHKTRIMGLPGSEDSLTIELAVLTQYQRVTDGHTDKQTLTRRMAIANWTCVSWVAYAPGPIAVNVTLIEREFNADQTPRSMYPSVFNRFPVI